MYIKEKESGKFVAIESVRGQAAVKAAKAPKKKAVKKKDKPEVKPEV